MPSGARVNDSGSTLTSNFETSGDGKDRAIRPRMSSWTIDSVVIVLLDVFPLVLLVVFGTLHSTNLRTQAGVLKPVLQLLQPIVDNH